MLINKLLIFGYGYCAKALISRLINKKNKILVVSRNKQNIDKLNKEGIKACEWLNEDVVKHYINSSHTILITVPPCNFIDPVEEKFARFFIQPKNKIRLIYLSSTGVYGDHKGAWVNENSKLKPTTELGKWRLNAEKKWLSFAKLNNLPISILRLSGIYGPERSTFNRIENKSFKIVRSPELFFSRIHIDDIVTIILKFLERENINGIYNLSDNLPATSESLYLETYKLLNLKPPDPKNLNELNLSKAALGFFSESKKVKNNKLVNDLGYKFIHPDYISGLKDIYKKIKSKKI
ncbi:MAG: NAD-dependent epimerase/dehydratase family protein [Paracoccaceae bacterium]